MRFLFFWLKQRQIIASLHRPETLEAHVKSIAILIATCLIPVPLRPQERSPATKTPANSRASSGVTLGERLAREYEKTTGLGSTPELDGGYIIVGDGLLAIAQTEDELANVLAHEIEHMELGQVSRRVSELGKQKEIKNLQLRECHFRLSYYTYPISQCLGLLIGFC